MNSAIDNTASSWSSPDVLVQALVGIGTVLIALVALLVARRSNATAKESFLVEIRREWNELKPDWNRTLMYVMGADHYYHDVDPQERVEHHLRVTAFAGDGKTFNTEQWEWVRWQRATVTRVAMFFAYASDALVTGRWALNDAYSLFGPDVARHWEAIVWMAHRRPVSDVMFATPGGNADWVESVEQLPEFNFFDRQDSLVVLAFLLRSEQCRRGDTYPHFVVAFAHALRTGLTPVRRALWRVSRARGHWIPRLSLRAAIHRGAYPYKRSAFMFDRSPLVQPDEFEYFRRPYESAIGNRRRIARMNRAAEF